jgi:FKBP-type peptidyl-prolyl cis-trans isomerase SlyD
VSPTFIKGLAMTIAEGKVVAFSYVLKNSKGDELDRAEAGDPLYYLHGSHQIVPGLEDKLTGLKKGDKKSVVVAPKDGYGEIVPDLKLTVDRSQFPEGLELKEGMQFSADVGGGQEMPFRIASVGEDSVEIDGNHPLAGEALHFDVTIQEVRDATEEEVEHGHAHGPGGHHHH